MIISGEVYEEPITLTKYDTTVLDFTGTMTITKNRAAITIMPSDVRRITITNGWFYGIGNGSFIHRAKTAWAALKFIFTKEV